MLNYQDTLREKIKFYKIELGISYCKMCDSMGISNSTLSAWVRGVNVSEKILKKIVSFIDETERSSENVLYN